MLVQVNKLQKKYKKCMTGEQLEETILPDKEYIPLTNRVRGPYCKLRTEVFPLRFMAQAQGARVINRRRKNEDP